MFKHLCKRGLSALMALVLVLAAIPVTTLAAETDFTLIPLKGTDVTLDETVFTYTGSEIRPNVTVRVEDRLLTLGKDYTLSYSDNIEVGTGKVTVTGIATAAPSYGYTGTVEIPFEIKAADAGDSEPPVFTLVEIKGTDVTIDGTEFAYTGEAIEPQITVTVGGKTLTAGRDYALTYENNTEPGTATVTVTGIATASEEMGYTGTVKINFTILEKKPEFILVEIKGTDVIIEGTEFTYTGEAIEPKVIVTVDGKTLTVDKEYSLAYRNNIEPGTATVTVTGIATASETLGYTGTVEIDFTIKAPETALTEIKGTDVTIEGTKFTYTGSYIEPKITVTVSGKILTAGEDYRLTYHNNIGAGTATASVTGIASAGYTGQVNVNFTIEKDAQKPEFTMVELKESHVTIEGKEFTHTGKAIEPKITVTVDGKVLTLGNDYSLNYKNNIAPGTASAIITGIATASDTVGYTGQVTVTFTILEKEADKDEGTGEGENDNDGEDGETEPFDYAIIKGNNAKWYAESVKTLSFTADGDVKDFKGIKIDGKDLPEKYYLINKEGNTVITLTNAFLKKLALGKHTVTVVFRDGQAEGSFRVLEGLDTTNPETGDRFAMGAWLSVLGISLAAATGLIVLRKRLIG